MGNTADNLLTQLAASACGVRVVTVKNAEGAAKAFEEMRNCRGMISDGAGVDACGQVSQQQHAPVVTSGDSALPHMQFSALLDADEDSIFNVGSRFVDEDDTLAHYGGGAGVCHKQLLQQAAATQATLQLGANDSVCVPITLNHSFGMGFGVAAVFGR